MPDQPPSTIIPITTQKVHYVLQKAGFTGSKSYPTRVRGWHNWTAGYVIQKKSGGRLSVFYCLEMFDRDPEDKRLARLEDMRKALADAGLSVRIEDDHVVIG